MTSAENPEDGYYAAALLALSPVHFAQMQPGS
jgi:hypothetical protein